MITSYPAGSEEELTYVLIRYAIVTVIIMLFVGLWGILRIPSTKYVITNKRIATRAGVLSDKAKSLSYKHVTSVTVQQGILGRILNYGTIHIDTSGSGEEVEKRWLFVNNPIFVKKKIENHIS